MQVTLSINQYSIILYFPPVTYTACFIVNIHVMEFSSSEPSHKFITKHIPNSLLQPLPTKTNPLDSIAWLCESDEKCFWEHFLCVCALHMLVWWTLDGESSPASRHLWSRSSGELVAISVSIGMLDFHPLQSAVIMCTLALMCCMRIHSECPLSFCRVCIKCSLHFYNLHGILSVVMKSFFFCLSSGNRSSSIKSYSDVANAWADSASTSSYSSLVQRLPV